ncbi:MAG: hypothetical protein EAZ99_13760 [Alphaproteobacteria bacterium]|nr:hypothetical protein [Alphaproteobacteria bacterium]TAD88462.1 MAG: hypothetical protein EAZ99_13760 [Alphaproteobacteria bacterium]
MSSRDPRHDPRPGDALRVGSGALYRVTGTLMSVLEDEAGERPCVVVSIDRPCGQQRQVLTLPEFSHRVRQAEVESLADAAPTSWPHVRRVRARDLH